MTEYVDEMVPAEEGEAKPAEPKTEPVAKKLDTGKKADGGKKTKQSSMLAFFSKNK